MQLFWRLPACLCVARHWVQKKTRSSSGIAERATKFRLKAGVPHMDKLGDSTGRLELVASAPMAGDLTQSQRKAI
jgi:hypothetical protein